METSPIEKVNKDKKEEYRSVPDSSKIAQGVKPDMGGVTIEKSQMETPQVKEEKKRSIMDRISRAFMDEKQKAQMDQGEAFADQYTASPKARKFLMSSPAWSWVNQGYDAPTQSEMQEIIAAAEQDGYEGKLGADETNNKIVYRDSKNITWRGGGAGTSSNPSA